MNKPLPASTWCVIAGIIGFLCLGVGMQMGFQVGAAGATDKPAEKPVPRAVKTEQEKPAPARPALSRRPEPPLMLFHDTPAEIGAVCSEVANSIEAGESNEDLRTDVAQLARAIAALCVDIERHRDRGR